MYLNFAEISKVPFTAILDHLNIPYEETSEGLKGQGFIVNTDKNLYKSLIDENRGSIINFWNVKNGYNDLRRSASEIKTLFIDKTPEKEKETKLPDYPFIYHEWLKTHNITEEEAQLYEMTYCKKGILAGKIAILIRSGTGEKVGYIGKNIGKDGYFYPKQFNAGDYLYNLHTITGTACTLVSDPFKVIEHAKRGNLNAVSLLSPNLTDAQANLLKRFQFIEIDHPSPSNIILRLSRTVFIKQV